MELRLLGSLQMLVAGEEVPLGGAKQRTVLATLLLRAGEVVPVERLIDEIWGDDPPQSAAHSLESYVSRLRQVLSGHGPVLVRRGSGYCLELGDATLDADAFEKLASMAGEAADAGDHRRTSELVREALSYWRGPVLGDVALGPTGRAGAERLEELRLHALEQRFDAELALGRDKELVGELQSLVGQNPYREQFVGQLMLALYRARRQAEALDVYEETRRRLDSDLGLLPSAELRVLSAQIVRQEPQLRRPSRPVRAEIDGPIAVGRRVGRLSGLVALGSLLAAAMAFTASGGAAVPERVTPTAQHLALVLPSSAPSVAEDGLVAAVEFGEIQYDLETQVESIDPQTLQRDVDRVVARVRNEGVGVVMALGDGPAARALATTVRRFPETRFVFIEATLRELSLEGVPNAAAIRFGDEDIYDLMGYVSGLVPTLDGSKRYVDVVSVVAGEATPATARLIAGFKRGLRAARPGVKVLVDYSRELEDPTHCEQLANRQIDRGSDVILAAAGECGLGAVAVARVRGVWSAGAEEDGVPARDDVLMMVKKEWLAATRPVLEHLVKGTFPMGRDIVLGLEDGYATTFWFSILTPEKAASAVVERCSKLRASGHQDF